MRKRYALILVAALLACKDDGIGPSVLTVDITTDSVALDLDAAPSKTLPVTVNGASQKATFLSLNSAIAAVDSNGVVTAKTVGSTYVVAAVGTTRDSARVIVHGSICTQTTPANILSGVVSPSPVAFSALETSIASSPIQIPLLGTGRVDERYTAEVAALGNVAYTTTWGGISRNGNVGNAVKIWNVSGNTPVLTDSIIVRNAGTTSDVQISDDNKLLVISVESSSPSDRNGIAIYDLTNPSKPALIRHFACPSTVKGVHTVKLSRVNGKLYAFLSIDPSPAGLVVVDITDPVNAKDVYSKAMGQPYLHDVFVRDGILFTALWHTGMTIFDIGGAGKGGSPSAPVAMGTVKTLNCSACAAGSSSVHNIWWFNDPKTGSKKYAFIGEEGPASFFSIARGDIHVVDVSDFNNPREVAFYSPDPATTSSGQVAGSHNFDMDEASGVLYAAYYNGGVRALDVRGDLSTCAAAEKSADGRCNLRLMGRELGVGLNTSVPIFVWGVKLVGNFLYASDMPNGLHKLDITALKRP